MKTLLVPTDFSVPAQNAAEYALHLAKTMKADIKLCHALKIPAEAPAAPQVAWPLEDYTTIKEEANEELRLLAEQLETKALGIDSTQSYYSNLLVKVGYCSEIGTVSDVVRNLADQDKVPLVVMGMSGAGALSRVFLGSSSKDMIDKACFPVLLIPAEATFKGIKRIALATNLDETDIDIIHSLSTFARYYNAEILLLHITEAENNEPNEKQVKQFLSSVTNKANYPNIYYRQIHSRHIDEGIAWLLEHGHIDIIAMIHRQRAFIERIFKSSHTQKMAVRTTLPLLVFPEGKTAYF